MLAGVELPLKTAPSTAASGSAESVLAGVGMPLKTAPSTAASGSAESVLAGVELPLKTASSPAASGSAESVLAGGGAALKTASSPAASGSAESVLAGVGMPLKTAPSPAASGSAESVLAGVELPLKTASSPLHQASAESVLAGVELPLKTASSPAASGSAESVPTPEGTEQLAEETHQADTHDAPHKKSRNPVTQSSHGKGKGPAQSRFQTSRGGKEGRRGGRKRDNARRADAERGARGTGGSRRGAERHVRVNPYPTRARTDLQPTSKNPRREQMVYGWNAVLAVVGHRPQDVLKVLYGVPYAKPGHEANVRTLKQWAQRVGCNMLEVETDALRLACRSAHHEGIAVEAKPLALQSFASQSATCYPWQGLLYGWC